MHTLREIVRITANTDGLGPDDENARYQKARVLYQTRAVSPTEDVGRGQTARYDTRTAAMLAVYLTLADVGVSARDARNFFSKQRSDSIPGAVQAATQFDAALEGAARREEWELRIEFRRVYQSGERTLLGGFQRVGEELPPRSKGIIDAWAACRATVIVPVTPIVAPFLSSEG